MSVCPGNSLLLWELLSSIIYPVFFFEKKNSLKFLIHARSLPVGRCHVSSVPIYIWHISAKFYNLLTVANRNGESEKASGISKNKYTKITQSILTGGKLTGQSLNSLVLCQKQFTNPLPVQDTTKNNTYSYPGKKTLFQVNEKLTLACTDIE